jgi:hypothetical protein
MKTAHVVLKIAKINEKTSAGSAEERMQCRRIRSMNILHGLVLEYALCSLKVRQHKQWLICTVHAGESLILVLKI